jgi:tetratricopeptide (TPR) repeat protein
VRRLAALVAALVLVSCTTPLERGERLYREGDRLGALEVWRQIPPDSLHHEAARQRIAEVEDEFHQLVVRYKQRARYFERKERLAEAILNYRLAAKLEPEDRESMAHVQDLSRVLAARKIAVRQAYKDAFARGDLPEARAQLIVLRQLDPFDPDLETDQAEFEAALRGEVDQRLAQGRRDFNAGRYASAEREFHSVLDLEPGNESAQGYLSYIASGREEGPGSAGKGASSGTIAHANATEAQIRAEGFYQNALADEQKGDGFAAIQQDLRALEADPHHAGARKHLAAVRQNLAPQVDSLIESGRTAFREEDLQAALDQWRKALLVDPDNERALGYVARTEKLLENLEQLRAEPDGSKSHR